MGRSASRRTRRLRTSVSTSRSRSITKGASRRTRIQKRTQKKRTRGGYHKDTIPRIVHQIWFGSEVPSWRQYIFDKMREACERNGYKYRLWKEEDRTRKNFPITHPYQEDGLRIGKEQGQNRYAQVADLARLEILYHHGGIYLDSIFMVRDAFFRGIETLNICDKKTFLCANEDPCGLDCENAAGEKYLSNSFIASIPKHPVLSRLLDADTSLDNIDLESSAINKTTGPYFLRSGIVIVSEAEENIGIIPTEKIYPFPMSGSVLREPKENNCLTQDPEDKSNVIQVSNVKYLYKNCMERNPDAWAVYLVGLGGSWSL